MGCPCSSDKKYLTIIEVRSWNNQLLDTITLKKTPEQTSGQALYHLISNKSKNINSQKYFLPELEKAQFLIQDIKETSNLSVTKFSIQNLPDLNQKKCFVFVEQTLSNNLKPVTFKTSRKWNVTQDEQGKVIIFQSNIV